MGKYTFGFLFLLVCSCSSHNAIQPLGTGKLTYSAYTWHYNPGKDSFELYIANYLCMDSNGRYIGMRHDTFMDRAKYFAGTINDSLRKCVDSILSISSNKRDFIFSANSCGMYDGFTYAIEYRNRDSMGSSILSVPSFSPLGIQFVESILDSVAANSVPNPID